MSPRSSKKLDVPRLPRSRSNTRHLYSHSRRRDVGATEKGPGQKQRVHPLVVGHRNVGTQQYKVPESGHVSGWITCVVPRPSLLRDERRLGREGRRRYLWTTTIGVLGESCGGFPLFLGPGHTRWEVG